MVRVHPPGKETPIKPRGIASTFLLAVMLLAWPMIVLGAGGDDIVGLWDTPDKDARFEIYRCGMEYCGRIVHLEEPTYPADDDRGMAGLPMVDRNNPDPTLRNRPLVGLPLLRGFRFKGDNRWEDGRIYNPENGKIYQAKISLADYCHLMLRGYWGISLLGRTEIWARHEASPRDECLQSARADLRREEKPLP